MKDCEAWIGDAWRTVLPPDLSPIKDKLLLRCPACHGPVHFERKGKHMPDRFEHNQNAHKNCSRFHKLTPPFSLSPSPLAPPANAVGPDGRDAMSDALANVVIGNVDETHRQTLIKARIGQGQFRSDLISRWRTCSVTGFGPVTVLVASHIIPWCKCATNAERLDVNNGLLLTPNIDKLFDRGLISFDPEGRVHISPKLGLKEAANLGINGTMRLRYVPEAIKPYLHRHMQDGHFQAA